MLRPRDYSSACSGGTLPTAKDSMKNASRSWSQTPGPLILQRAATSTLLNLMTAAIGKWLVTLVPAQAPSRVELASTHGYRVDPAAPCEDLVSIALRFEPVIEAPEDALSPVPPTSTIECDNAKGILRRVSRRLDVDAILARTPDLNEELIDETKRLLAQARFDVTDYRTWLAS